MLSEAGRVLSRLLEGAYICQVSDEEGWRFLKQRENQNQIKPHLDVLNRQLSTAADGSVFYASYISIGEEERKHLTAQFAETTSQLMPLVEWLVLVQQATQSDVPLAMGSAIRLSELQQIIEDTPAFRETLEKIARYRLFGSTSVNMDGQLKQVFKRLTDLGYLLKPNSEKQIYLATGKIEYLYEVIKFIDETEGLGLAEQAEAAIAQGSLL
ncbi:hypothetical protein DRW07_03555 [Alteromonas sediminis]|uniref:DUF4194 domain-containing protein n=1 Tax=Alteromonas sediminis TaxID=2259342 RepID=A0A3N5Y5E8_9ALTE|nr:hypothetical protein [Alteromonas sediminis]RPJ68493.1 hypothetical protein DRW07_03555 [Alteromonas sediminis]